MDFGKYAEYMALGYAAMLILLGGMVLWMVLRYQALRREQAQIEQLEAEVRDEVAATVGAVERQAQPEATTPGVSGMTNPSTDRAREVPHT